VVLESAAELTAPEGSYVIGSTHGPEHTGLFEPAQHGFAPGFNHSRTHEQSLLPKLGIAHAFGKWGKWSDLYHYFTDESGIIRFDITHDASKKGLVVRQQLHPSVTVN
jgi:hypothetical protein